MRKLFLFTTLVFLVTMAFSQAVQRNVVVVEIGTGTWCTYCPGAANGAHDLITNGQQVAIIENHNGDGFANSYSNARNTYYGITGYPTAFFDGVLSHVGGAACPNGNAYSSYLPLYNTRYAIPSPLVIDISGSNSGNTYNIVLSVKKLASISSSELKVHLVLVESDISTPPWPGSGGCMTEVDHVNRIMVPNELGTPISFTSGDMQIITLSFNKDAAWVAANCELVAFVQDAGTKETFNGVKVALNSLPPPMNVDFTGTPTTGCAPLSTSYTDQSTGATNWQWEFQGGSPATSSSQNPTVSYTTAGTYNTTLTAWSNVTNRGNKKVKTGYMNVTAVPVAPSQPTGSAALCANPPDVVYSTIPPANATSFNWDLTPPSAGVITNNGSSCSINFDNAFLGTATLKVQGVNACGIGAWSPALTITLSTPPSVPGTPAGPAQLCLNPPNTDYTTTGATPATSYVWDLTPSGAGTVIGTGTTISVFWTDTYTGTAQLKVSALNNGCQGPWSATLDINVSPNPASFQVNGGGPYCAIGGTGVPVGLDDSESGVNYTLFLDGTATTTTIPGTGAAITFGNQMAAGTYTVEAVNTTSTCAADMTGNAVVEIDPQVPNAPEDPTGPSYVNSSATPTTDYLTSGGQYARTYTWEVIPAAAGTFSGNTTTGTVTWDPAFAGTAQVKVQGENTCGGGDFSVEFEVEVDNTVGISENINGNRIKVFPNPARETLSIQSDLSLVADMVISNSLGMKVMMKKNLAITGTSTLNISNLPSGVYFLNLMGAEINQVVKIVVE